VYLPLVLTLKESYTLLTDYLYVLYVFHIETMKFSYAALADWFL